MGTAGRVAQLAERAFAKVFGSSPDPSSFSSFSEELTFWPFVFLSWKCSWRGPVVQSRLDTETPELPYESGRALGGCCCPIRGVRPINNLFAGSPLAQLPGFLRNIADHWEGGRRGNCEA